MNKKIKTIFWLLISSFVVIISYFMIPFANGIKDTLLVCPIIFLIGAIGSIIMLKKDKKGDK